MTDLKCAHCNYPLEVEEECEHIAVFHCTGCADITYEVKKLPKETT